MAGSVHGAVSQRPSQLPVEAPGPQRPTTAIVAARSGEVTQLPGLAARQVQTQEPSLAHFLVTRPEPPLRPRGRAAAVAVNPRLAEQAMTRSSQNLIATFAGDAARVNTGFWHKRRDAAKTDCEAVLRQFHRYNATLGGTGTEGLAQAKSELASLEQSIEKYVRGGFFHPHKTEMRQLLQLVRMEKALLEQEVAPQLAATRSVSGLLEAMRRSMLGNTGIPLSAKTQTGMLRPHHVEGELRPLGHGAFNQVSVGTFRGADGVAFQGVFKPEPEARMFTGRVQSAMVWAGIDTVRPNQAGRSVATWRLAHMLGSTVIPRTEFAVLQVSDGQGGQAERVGSVMALATGISPMTKGTARVDVPADVADFFARNPEALEAFARSKGFEQAQLSGTTVRLTPPGTVDRAGRLKEGTVFAAADHRDPVLRRQLTELQWMDALCGQSDRHLHNYFVECDAQGRVLGVKGIDNDASWGPDTNYAEAIAGPPDWLHGARMPNVIDRALADRISGLSEATLRDELSGLLTPTEIQAAVYRLRDVQLKIAFLRQSGRVIEGDQAWGGQMAAEALGLNLVERAGRRTMALPRATRATTLNDAVVDARRRSYAARQAAWQLRAAVPDGYFAVIRVPELVAAGQPAESKAALP